MAPLNFYETIDLVKSLINQASMEKASENYDPQVLARIASLKISAMNLVDGLLTGQHRSRHTTAGQTNGPAGQTRSFDYINYALGI